MNDRPLEDRLRDWYRPLAGDSAPTSLHAAVAAIPDRVPARTGWRHLFRSRPALAFATLLVGGAVVAAGLFAVGGSPRSAVVPAGPTPAATTGPTPAPSTADTAAPTTAAATASPTPTAPAAPSVYPVTTVAAGNGLIAYSSAGRIHLVGPDGVEVRTLGSADAVDYKPAWSPDGTMLAFFSEPCHPATDRCPAKDAPASLVVTNADGSGRRELVGGLLNPLSLTWSPDGSRIAIDPFPSVNTPVGPRITVVSVADGRTKVVGSGQFPVWTPDAAAIAYEGDQEIHLANADGSGDRVLVARGASGSPEWPSVWTVDGSHLLFLMARGIVPANRREWVVNRDGSDPHEFSIPGPDLFLSLSPDGRSILWFRQSTVAGTAGRYVVTEIDGSGPRVIDLSSATWSPDGKRLAGMPLSNGNPSGLTIVDPTGAVGPISVTADGPFGWSWQRLP